MSLRVWLPLNGDLHNQGLSNISVTNNGATVNTGGKIGSCYSFDKSIPTYLKLINPIISNNSGISFAFWIKVPANASGNNQVIHIGNGAGWNNNRCTCFIKSGTSQLVFTCGDGTDSSSTHSTQYNCISSAITLNQWTHVVCSYITGLMKIYINGIENKNYTTTIAPKVTNIEFIGIGAAPNAGEPCTCYLNDVRIYDHALSELEIKEIARGLILHYPLNNNGISNLEIQEPTIEYDISGYCNNGIKTGTFTYSTNTPKYRLSTYINNGVNDYITTSATIGNPADAITMNIWFKSSCTTPGSNYHEAFNHATSVQYFEFAIYKTGFFRQGITINGTRYVINGGSGLLDGNWHMLTATYDGTAIKRYIDGEIITDMTQLVTGTLNGANAKFLIGHYGSNTSYYAKEAYLSDARIYATALSAQDILSLYHNSALVDEQGIIHGAIH